MTFKFNIVEDSEGRRIVENTEKPFNWLHFLHMADLSGWISRDKSKSYNPVKFNKKIIKLELRQKHKDFALEIHAALLNYGFKGVLTIDDKIIFKTVSADGN